MNSYRLYRVISSYGKLLNHFYRISFHKVIFVMSCRLLRLLQDCNPDESWHRSLRLLCFRSLFSCFLTALHVCPVINYSKNSSIFLTVDNAFPISQVKSTIILLVYPSKILDKHVFIFSWDLCFSTMVPRETGNNTYAKFWGDKQRVLCYFLYWLM